MRCDPAVHEAAVALRRGIADPLQFLALHPADHALLADVVREADLQQDEHERALADYAAARVIELLVKAIR